MSDGFQIDIRRKALAALPMQPAEQYMVVFRHGTLGGRDLRRAEWMGKRRMAATRFMRGGG